MSEFNTIARRPHVPREMETQGLLKDLGVTLPKKVPSATPSDDDDEASFGEEDAESESEEEDDPVVETSSLPISIFLFDR